MKLKSRLIVQNPPKFIFFTSLAIIFATTAFAITSLLVLHADRAEAVDLSGWRAGNIIDDFTMTNYRTMTAADIQNFLNARNPNCLPGATCLRNFTENGRTAAQILFDASQEFRINPQVLIVKLEKEQGLVTHRSPEAWRFRTAMGYGCPDSTPGVCDGQFWGFTNQTTWAARMMRAIMNQSPTWWVPFRLGWNSIHYHQDLQRCGHSPVYIENLATLALYSYTPYQPNAATLAAGIGGIGNARCGAYGNRNFYIFFNAWFGPTRQDDHIWRNMDEPRWLEATGSTWKIDIETNQRIGSQITEGHQIFFSTRLNRPNTLCLRTEFDELHDIPHCILLSDLRPVVINYDPINLVIEAREPVSKEAFINRRNVPKSTVSRYRQIEVVERFTLGKGTFAERTFYRTRFDQTNGNLHAFPAEAFAIVNYNFESIDTLSLSVIPGAQKRALTFNSYDTWINPNLNTLTFASRISRDGRNFYRTTHDTDRLLGLAIPANYLRIHTLDLQHPRWMSTIRSTQKINLLTGEVVATIPANTAIYFSHQIWFNDVRYFQAREDINTNYVIIAQDISEIPFTNLDTPRIMTLAEDAFKIDPTLHQPTQHGPYQANTSIQFTSRIVIDGQIFYRSAFDQARNNRLTFPASALR
ncbi:hypothetical protein FWD07_02090 [Candidatus Saccharibacteria bacterium]|nr:hypothetical protein [Candidatus Saccharibacteria bacterium]